MLLVDFTHGKHGLRLVGGVDTPFRSIFVAEVKEGCPAARAGLAPGDRLISVDKYGCLLASAEDIYFILAILDGPTEVMVQRVSEADWLQLKSSSATPLPSGAAGTHGHRTPVRRKSWKGLGKGLLLPAAVHDEGSGAGADEPERRLLTGRGLALPLGTGMLHHSLGPVVAVRLAVTSPEAGFGMRLVGGADTLYGGIFVSHVHAQGAAIDSRALWPGCRLLEVNGISLMSATLTETLELLSGDRNPVLVVQRLDRAAWEWVMEELPLQGRLLNGVMYSVTIPVQRTAQLQLRLVPGCGLFVESTGSTAPSCADDDEVHVGDLLVAAADEGLLCCTPSECLDTLRSLNGAELLVLRNAFDSSLLNTGAKDQQVCFAALTAFVCTV